MKIKIKILLYAICILFLSINCFVRAEDLVQIPDEFKNKDFLTNVNWTDVNLIQGIISSWDNYSGKQEFKGEEVLRKKDIQIYGTVFSAGARRFTSDGVFKFVFLDKGDFPEDFRKKFMSYAVKTWGEPSNDIDYSLASKEDYYDSHEIEWLLKNTHIKFAIFGAKMYNGWIPGTCYIVITQKGKYAPLKELIALKCEGQKKLIGFSDSTEITPVSPFVVVIDLNRNNLLRRDRSVLGEFTQVSDNYYISEWQDEKIKHRFVIDRKLGTYEWKVTSLKSNENYGSVNWGTCEKTNLHLEPKF